MPPWLCFCLMVRYGWLSLVLASRMVVSRWISLVDALLSVCLLMVLSNISSILDRLMSICVLPLTTFFFLLVGFVFVCGLSCCTWMIAVLVVVFIWTLTFPLPRAYFCVGCLVFMVFPLGFGVLF